MTPDDLLKDPSSLKKISDDLYDLSLESVLETVSVGTPGTHISAPTSIVHHVHVRFDSSTGKFEGIPDAMREAIRKAGFTEEQIGEKPELAKNVLYELRLDEVLRDAAIYISEPTHPTHNASITFNKATGEYEGIPQEVLDAFEKEGLTKEQFIADPSKGKDILYRMNLADVFFKPNPMPRGLLPAGGTVRRSTEHNATKSETPTPKAQSQSNLDTSRPKVATGSLPKSKEVDIEQAKKDAILPNVMQGVRIVGSTQTEERSYLPYFVVGAVVVSAVAAVWYWKK